MISRRLTRGGGHGAAPSVTIPEATYDLTLSGLDWVPSLFDKERRIPVVRASGGKAAEFTALVCGPWTADMAQVSRQCELLRQVVPLHTVHFDYGGFGLARSAQLSERRCVDDAVSVYRWLLERHSTAPQRLLLVGVEVGACVALELAYLATRPPADQRKLLGFTLPTPVCAALVLQAPAIAPALGLAAALLRTSALAEPFAAHRKHLAYISVPALVAVGKKQRAPYPSASAAAAPSSPSAASSSPTANSGFNSSSSSNSSSTSTQSAVQSGISPPVVDPAHVAAAAKQLKFLWRLLEIDDVDSDLYDDDDYLGAVRALVGVMLGTVDESDRAIVAALSNRPTQFQSPEEVISAWLREIGLQEHATRFVANGYDSLPIIRTMSVEELASIGITDETQQALLLSSLADDSEHASEAGDSFDSRRTSSGGLVRAASTSRVNASSMPPSLATSPSGTSRQRVEKRASDDGASTAAASFVGAAPGVASRASSTAWSAIASVLRVHDGVAIDTAHWLETPTCACCSVPFTLLRRRHHCRACGACVCFACSKGTLALASRSSLPSAPAISKSARRSRHSTSVEHNNSDAADDAASAALDTVSAPPSVASTPPLEDDITPLTSPRGTAHRTKVLVRRKRRTSASLAQSPAASPAAAPRHRGKTTSSSSLSLSALPGLDERSRACDRCCDARAKILQLSAHEQALVRALSLDLSAGQPTLAPGLSALFVEERGSRYPCTVLSCGDGAAFVIEIADITRADARRVHLLARDLRSVRRGPALFPANSMPDPAKTSLCFTIVGDAAFYHFQAVAPADDWIAALEALSRCMQQATTTPPMPPIAGDSSSSSSDSESDNENANNNNINSGGVAADVNDDDDDDDDDDEESSVPGDALPPIPQNKKDE